MEMNTCEWVSTRVKVSCISWAPNLTVRRFSPQLASFLWKAAALAAECRLQHICKQSGCETCQMKVHSAQSSLCLSLSDTVPLMWTLLDYMCRRKNWKIKPALPPNLKSTLLMKLFDISHNLYHLPCHSSLPRLSWSVSKLICLVLKVYYMFLYLWIPLIGSKRQY